MPDHNEAMRLAQALKNRQEVEDDAADMLMQQAEQIDQLRAEVERLRDLVKIPVPSDHTHQCRACLYAYTPQGDDEDCPRCGFDGADPATSRTTHKD